MHPSLGCTPLINKNVPAETFQDPAADPPSFGQQQADALGLLAETALHHGIDPGTPGERYQVVVHVDAPALADPDAPSQSVLEEGTHVPAETSRRLPDVPPPGAVPINPVEMLRAQNDARGFHIGAQTSMPGWLGERLDVGYAIDVLHPLARCTAG